MKLAIAFVLASLASPAVALKTNKIRRGEAADDYNTDRGLQSNGGTSGCNGGTSGPGCNSGAKSGGSKGSKGSEDTCALDGPCDASDYASYGYVDFKHGEIRYNFRYDVKCNTPPAFDGCCDSRFGFESSFDFTNGTPQPGTGKACIRAGGVYIADDDNDAAYSCCDPRLFEHLLNSKHCVVDGSKGVCWTGDDDCTPIRFSTGYSACAGGNLECNGGGAQSGIFAGVAGCDEKKVLEIYNKAPQCT